MPMTTPGQGKTVLITTWPFAAADDTPRRLLRRAGFRLVEPARATRLKLQTADVVPYLGRVDAVIAGTERYDARLLAAAGPRLRLLSRVGIGTDNVDFAACARCGLEVAYTPGASTEAVAELALGLLLDCLRGITRADGDVRRGAWQRFIGRELAALTVGIIGLGRIGKRVAQLLQPFGCRVLANDLAPDRAFARRQGVTLVSKAVLYRRSDIVTLHTPLTPLTRGFCGAAQLRAMPRGGILINTARGGLVDERALAAALRGGRLAAAGIDVFVHEPYTGPLATLPGTVLTAHMGSCSDRSRVAMETGAAQNVIDFFAGRRAWGRVPDEVRAWNNR